MKPVSHPSFMIVPGMSCQARCSYCFGPHRGPEMSPAVAEKTVEFIASAAAETGQKNISVTFHGGEPLLVPFSLWQYLLSEISERMAHCKVRFAVQSNLWAMDNRFAELFAQYNVSVGTSIDGPKKICDETRGPGYWERTMQGIAKAHEYGLNVGAIATLTRSTADLWRETASFFIRHNMGMNLHPAVPVLGSGKNSSFALDPNRYAQAVKEIFPFYVRHRKVLSISTLDNICKGCVNGDPEVCTFRDCFGIFMVVSPDGSIYPCQRFCGDRHHALGNVAENPSLAEIYRHPNAVRMIKREQGVARRCRDCREYPVCRGGCYYNALAGGDGIIDHLCEAYKEIFSFVRERMLEEMTLPENMEAIAEKPPRENENPLLRKGAYISLAKKKHPREIASTARTVLGLYELAKADDPAIAAQQMIEKHYSGDPVQTEMIMRSYFASIRKIPEKLNNLYLHATFNCNLRCTHCYAASEKPGKAVDIALLSKLLKDALNIGFRQVIITGGEPLIHPRISELLDRCSRFGKKGMNIVLRTNLTGRYSDDFFKAVGRAFDQVVVSVDGNEETHDKRRGKGVYKTLIKNLESFQRVCKTVESAAELSLACVMNSRKINSEPGWSVKRLAARLGVRRTRFRPLLPLGRAAEWKEPVLSEGLLHHLSSEEILEAGLHPQTTCGIGHNIYIEPNGASFPCYAYHRPHSALGNAGEMGLEKIISSEKFKTLTACTVNKIEKCRDCHYKYLCGGACRAWGNEKNQTDLYAPPPNCEHLQKKAQDLIITARNYIM